MGGELNVRAAHLPAVVLGAALVCATARGETRAVDPKRSTITVHVGKSGVFSAFGDNHEIRAPIASGTVDDGPKPSVDVKIDARTLTVLDPDLKPAKRAEVQEKMLGPDVLDVEHNPEIRFRSTKIAAAGEGRWHVEGTLELHNKPRTVAFDVTAADGRVKGTAKISQKAFGIPPISAGGGTVKVRDEVTIDFDITVEAGRAP